MSTIDDIKDILRGALASLGGFGGRMIARLALMITAGQLYGAAPLGVLGQVAALMEILAAIAVLGLKRSLLDLLSIASGRENNIVSTIKEALIGTCIISGAITVLFALSWPYMFPDIVMPTVLYFAVPAIALAEVAGTAIRFKRIIRWEVIARCVMEPWAFLAAVLVNYYLFKNTNTGLLSAYGISCIVAVTGIGIGMQRAFSLRALISAPIAWRQIYAIPKRSLPIGITDTGIMMFRRLDILILSLVAGHQITGVYYMAQQIVTVPHKIHQLFEPMMSPVIAKLHHANKRGLIRSKLSNICRWVFMLQLAVTVPFAIFSGSLLGLFNVQFISGAMILVVLLFAELLDGSFALTETPLIYAKPSIPPRLVAITLAIETVFVGTLTLQWGAFGTAIGFFVAMSSLTAMRLIYLKRHLNIGVVTVHYLRPVGFGLVVATALLTVQHFISLSSGPVIVGTILAAVIAFCLMIRMMAISPSDKLILKELKSSTPQTPDF